jgi:pimeloyl-ACP methyl ester carboxylesterase
MPSITVELQPEFATLAGTRIRYAESGGSAGSVIVPDIRTPVRIIAGDHDRVVPRANAEFLAEHLPNSRLTTVDAGHFVWEEAPGDYASIIADWVRGSS